MPSVCTGASANEGTLSSSVVSWNTAEQCLYEHVVRTGVRKSGGGHKDVLAALTDGTTDPENIKCSVQVMLQVLVPMVPLLTKVSLGVVSALLAVLLEDNGPAGTAHPSAVGWFLTEVLLNQPSSVARLWALQFVREHHERLSCPVAHAKIFEAVSAIAKHGDDCNLVCDTARRLSHPPGNYASAAAVPALLQRCCDLVVQDPTALEGAVEQLVSEEASNTSADFSSQACLLISLYRAEYPCMDALASELFSRGLVNSEDLSRWSVLNPFIRQLCFEIVTKEDVYALMNGARDDCAMSNSALGMMRRWLPLDLLDSPQRTLVILDLRRLLEVSPNRYLPRLTLAFFIFLDYFKAKTSGRGVAPASLPREMRLWMEAWVTSWLVLGPALPVLLPTRSAVDALRLGLTLFANSKVCENAQFWEQDAGLLPLVAQSLVSLMDTESATLRESGLVTLAGTILSTAVDALPPSCLESVHPILRRPDSAKEANLSPSVALHGI